jgi:hypothetical protein
LINKVIYNQLPPGVLPKLRETNPPKESGYRRWKHHQFLTEKTGEPHIDKQIIEVTTLLRISDNKDDFDRVFKRAFP